MAGLPTSVLQIHFPLSRLLFPVFQRFATSRCFSRCRSDYFMPVPPCKQAYLGLALLLSPWHPRFRLAIHWRPIYDCGGSTRLINVYIVLCHYWLNHLSPAPTPAPSIPIHIGKWELGFTLNRLYYLRVAAEWRRRKLSWVAEWRLVSTCRLRVTRRTRRFPMFRQVHRSVPASRRLQQ